MATLPSPNLVTHVACEQPPARELITSAFGLVYSDGGLLVTNLHHRGGDIPGGHVEAGEAPLGATPDTYSYPVPDSYQVFFLARPVLDHGGVRSAESSEARFWPVGEARSLQWACRNQALLEYALARWRPSVDRS